MGDRPGVDVWRVKSRAMALSGLLEGDFMLVDTHAAERVRAGDVVIAQIYTRTGANTVLRRFEPPVLVAASADPADGRVHVVDGDNVVIRGKVVASWRI
jgi:SOS-response transcriptional repressor LexA